MSDEPIDPTLAFAEKIIRDAVRETVAEYIGGISTGLLLAIMEVAEKTGSSAALAQALRHRVAILPKDVNNRDHIVAILTRLAEGLEGIGDLSMLDPKSRRLQ